jgi:sugar lactone lactonase YvrE
VEVGDTIAGLTATPIVFDSGGFLDSLKIQTGTGRNHVEIDSTSAPLDLILHGTDTVDVGNILASTLNLSNVQGSLNVVGNGNTTLNLNDVGGALFAKVLPNTYTLDRGTVKGKTVGHVNRRGAAPIYYAGLNNLVINGAQAVNVNWYVDATLCPVTINTGTFPSPNQIYVTQPSGDLRSLGGNLTIHGGWPGKTSVTVYNTSGASPAPVRDNYTITPTSMGYSDPVTINYSQIKAVTLFGGLRGTYNVTGVPDGASFTVNPGNGPNRFIVAPGVQGLKLNGLNTGPLVIDDSADTANASYTVTGSTVQVNSSTSISYTGAANVIVYGGSGNDAFTVTGAGAGSEISLYGGAGSNSFTVGSSTQGLGAFQGKLFIDAHDTGTVVVDDSHSTASTTYAATPFTVEKNGKTFLTYSRATALTLKGGTGSRDTFNILGTESATPVAVVGASTKKAIQKDVFNVGSSENTVDGIQGPLTVDGGNGITTLNLVDSGSSTVMSYTVNPGAVTFSGGSGVAFTHIDSLNIAVGQNDDTVSVPSIPTGLALSLSGAGSQSTLIGPDIANSWEITGRDYGTLDGTVQFQGFGSLRGGSVVDRFRFEPATNIKHLATQHPTGSVSGTIDGGGGLNTLDYSAFIGNVVVDLPLGVATLVGKGAQNILAVTGGTGSNLFVGAASTLSLTGGVGRNILIAGPAPATLTGNSGDDILVGGTTDFDRTLNALNAIMAEWSRTDLTYQARVDHLLHGGGLNGSTILNGSAFHGNGGGNTLTGSTGLDLFYGSKARDTYDWNSNLGEQFIESQDHQNTQIDARALSLPLAVVDDSTFDTTSVVSYSLAPGAHFLYGAHASGRVMFDVAPNGTVNYDPSLNGVLFGQGTPTLIVKGVTVIVDTRPLSLPSLNLDSALTVGNGSPFTFTGLPGTNVLTDLASGASVSFTLNADGTVGYDQSLEGILTGAGTSTLVVHGRTVTIDARASGVSTLNVDNALTASTSTPITFTGLPGPVSLIDSQGSGAKVTFTLNPDGTLDYDHSLDIVLSGRGTTTLVVNNGAFSNVSTFVSNINSPEYLAFDAQGNLYISELGSKVLKVTPDGTVSTFASNLSSPQGLAFDSQGNLDVAPGYGTTLNRIAPDGTVSSFGTIFSGDKQGLAFDANGNLYVANRDNNAVVRVSSDGRASVYVSSIRSPAGLAFDAQGNLYVSSDYNNNVMKVTTDGTVTTFATGFDNPEGLAVDAQGNLYVADTFDNRVCKVTPDGTVSTIATGLNSPEGLAFDAQGNLFVANYNGNSVSKVTLA